MKDSEKQVAEKAYHYALDRIAQARYVKALEYCRQALAVCAPEPGNEFDKLRVNAALTFSDLCHRKRRYHDEILNNLQIGMSAALRLGDQRHVALCHLHMGRAYGMTHVTQKAVESFTIGLELVEKFGDKDIMMRTADFSGHFHFLKGFYKEAVAYCEVALQRTHVGNDHVPEFLTPVILALSSALMGQFNRAIGVMDSFWRRSVLEDDSSLSAYYRAFLGQILVMTGKTDEGAFHLHAAEKEAQNNTDTYTIIWVRRCLAYYYYLRNDYRESYMQMAAVLALARDFGLPRPFYAAPWVLEILYSFHKEGFPPLSDYDFSQEISAALDGPNALLRGCALRLIALEKKVTQNDEDDEDDEDDLNPIENSLLESELELIRSGAAIELAKTRAELALTMLKKGNQTDAGHYALKAWEGWSAIGHDSFPRNLKVLINKGDVESRPLSRQKNNYLTKFLETIDKIPPSSDLDDMLSHLVNAACQFFEAERGGLFINTGESKTLGFSLRCGNNLTPEQVKRTDFRTDLLSISRAFETNASLIMIVPQQRGNATARQTSSILCFPFKIIKQEQGVMYFSKSYLDGAFDFINKEEIGHIAQSLSNYVARMFAYCRQLEFQSRVALTDMSVGVPSEVEVLQGFGEPFQNLMDRAEMVAKSDAPVLILGETGVGKEVLSKHIHIMSGRNRGPFVPINPSCIPEGLVDSELFGHEKGAFTGADHEKQGRMELAHMGTFFIDEIGEIPNFIQVKLLRALEEKALIRVGGKLRRDVNFRLITATNRDLIKEVEKGNFRQDLYYRLCVVTLLIPPLRERGDDVVKLAEEFLSHYNRKYQRPQRKLTLADKTRLMAYTWPGNVRELKNVIEQSVILSGKGKLELTIPKAPNVGVTGNSLTDEYIYGRPTLEDLERKYIVSILRETDGVIGGDYGAAKILGLKRTTLYKRMKKLGIEHRGVNQ